MSHQTAKGVADRKKGKPKRSGGEKRRWSKMAWGPTAAYSHDLPDLSYTRLLPLATILRSSLWLARLLPALSEDKGKYSVLTKMRCHSVTESQKWEKDPTGHFNGGSVIPSVTYFAPSSQWLTLHHPLNLYQFWGALYHLFHPGWHCNNRLSVNISLLNSKQQTPD